MGEATLTTSEYLEVVVATYQDTEKSFNLNNPKTNITLDSVKSAFEYLLNANDSDCVVFGDKNGEPYVTFKRANNVQTSKRITPLG